MKTKHVKYTNPKLEKALLQRDKHHKAEARKLAIHYASRNLPKPEGDNLSSYLGVLKAGYEADSAFINQELNPENLYPSLKLEVDHAEEKNKEMEGAIAQKNDENANTKLSLGGDELVDDTGARLRLVIIITIFLLIGEIGWNAVSLQATGANFLISLFLSIGISLGVFVLAHLIPTWYKEIFNRLKRILLVTVSSSIILALFYWLAIYRAEYLAHHGISFSPWAFVGMNMFFYGTSFILSYYLLPNWDELVEFWKNRLRRQRIKKNEKEIKGHLKKRSALRESTVHNTKFNMAVASYAKSLIEITRRRYFEAVEIFKSTNLAYRTDRKIPDCFNHVNPSPDVDHSKIPLITFKSSNQ